MGYYAYLFKVIFYKNDKKVTEIEYPTLYIKATDVYNAIEQVNRIHFNEIRARVIAYGFEVLNDNKLRGTYPTIWKRITALRKGNIGITLISELKYV